MKPHERITPDSREGAWTAKTLVKDIKRGKSNTVEIEFVARRPDRLRMEVTTMMGFHVASLVLSEGNAAYAITREKRYVRGPAEPVVMKSLINIALDPKAIVDLLFDRTLDPREWECKTDVNRLPELCTSRDGDLKIVWSERTNEKRLIEIRAANAEVTMSLVASRPKVQISDALFELPKPEGFKQTDLR